MHPKDAIAYLIAQGWSQASIGRMTNVSQPNICRIASGVEPGFDAGTRIVRLAQEVQAAAERRAKQSAEPSKAA